MAGGCCGNVDLKSDPYINTSLGADNYSAFLLFTYWYVFCTFFNYEWGWIDVPLTSLLTLANGLIISATDDCC